MLTEIVPVSDKSYWKNLVFEIAESDKESPLKWGIFVVEQSRIRDILETIGKGSAQLVSERSQFRESLEIILICCNKRSERDGYMRIRHKGKHIKITAVLLCVGILLLQGCGNRRGGETAEEAKSGENTGGMGRYVEEIYELPKEINRNGGLNVLSDGSMTIISYHSGLWRSSDGGASWQQEETAFFPMMQNVYALSAVMAPDGTVAVTCSGAMPEAARNAFSGSLPDDWEGNYCIFMSHEGDIKVVDFGFTQKDGSCLSTLCFKGDGRLFAGDMNGRIYEIDMEHENLKELFMMEREIGSIGFCGDVLMAAAPERLYLYDLAKKEMVPRDAVADQFIKSALAGGSAAYTGGGYPLTVFGGGDGVFYIACVDGLYRHVLGGSTVEQVVDGALSTFGDGTPIYFGSEIYDGVPGGGAESKESAGSTPSSAGAGFLAQFSGMLVRYHFDGSIPAMPDKEIRIYSLEENGSVRSAVTSFKKEHTDMYVRYEVGMDGGDGVTKEDAVKKLNTRILAGEGPDVIILDGLPLTAYMEKGLLADIGGLLENADGEKAESGAGLFANLTAGFREEDGAVYAMPLCVQVPLLVGDAEVIKKMEDLESFAAEMEALRAQNPEGGLLGIYDAQTMLELFGMVSSAAWTDETGEIDRSAVEGFLAQVKRIYDAERSGALPEETEALQKEDAEMEQYGVDPRESRMEVCNNVLGIRRGYARLACGYVDGIQICLDNVTSVIKLEENMRYKSFPGQERNAFVPKVMVGLNANSMQRAEAEAFIRKMFSAEAQQSMYDGFPVNREAFAARFDLSSPGDSNGSMTFLKRDGTEEELELLWPDEEEERIFTEFVEGLEKPVKEETQFHSLVYEEGVKVLEEEKSVREAVDEIERNAAIYLAE